MKKIKGVLFERRHSSSWGSTFSFLLCFLLNYHCLLLTRKRALQRCHISCAYNCKNFEMKFGSLSLDKETFFSHALQPAATAAATPPSSNLDLLYIILNSSKSNQRASNYSFKYTQVPLTALLLQPIPHFIRI